jgi:phosphomannomutase/phosphoglucomutase
VQEPKWGIIEVDGVRAQFQDGSWFLIRASNTVPKLTLKFEAPTRDLLLQRMKEVNEILKEYPHVDRTPLESVI